MINLLNKINSIVWGIPTLLLIFFTGVIISLRTDFFQVRFFKKALKSFFSSTKTRANKKMTPFQSASTALSATMGTGNIVGVAGCIVLGGPGAVFWMWVSALFCMIIKFAEIVLAVRYREQDSQGNFYGGAMYYIKNALPKPLSALATVFCVCGIAATFGVGNMVQINTMASSASALFRTILTSSAQTDYLIKLSVGFLCSICCGIILKNERRIGCFCEKIMPFMTITYIALTLGVVFYNYKLVPKAISQIFVAAFHPQSITGGVVGSAFIGLRFGMSRGVFSNEAGLGTAPIAYACSDGDEVSLGFMGIIEVFIDTIIVCTLTALTLLCTGGFNYGVDTAANLTLSALETVYGKNIVFLFCPIVCFFAFSSVIGWGLYGTKFISFLFGNKSKTIFLVLFTIVMIPSAIFRSDSVWLVAEILNGLMAIPNITALLFLTNEIADITYNYRKSQEH